jgi:hypothetical protein
MRPLVPHEPACGLEACGVTGRKPAAIRPSRNRTSAIRISPWWPRAKVAALDVTIDTSWPTDVFDSLSVERALERPVSL